MITIALLAVAFIVVRLIFFAIGERRDAADFMRWCKQQASKP
jgi:hypothetical protein